MLHSGASRTMTSARDVKVCWQELVIGFEKTRFPPTSDFSNLTCYCQSHIKLWSPKFSQMWSYMVSFSN